MSITAHYLLSVFFMEELRGDDAPLEEEALAAMPDEDLEARSFLMRFWAPVVNDDPLPLAESSAVVPGIMVLI